MSILKNRIKLKRMEIRIQETVDNNFGYCPSSIWFDELLDRRNDLSLLVSKEDRKWWDIYDKYKEAENCKELMVFQLTESK